MFLYILRGFLSLLPMKILNVIMRILLILILVMPVLGTIGVFPPPTEDMFTPQGWAFISALMNTGYMMPLMGLLNVVCLILVIMNRTALAAVLLAPFTVNVILFHVFLDASPVSAAAIPAYVLLITNVFFLWWNWGKYEKLWM